jgi:phosphatidylinositol alpha-1,6-mannosyltransferase
MRIGLVTSEFPPDIGGVETYSWHMAAELGRRPGIEVTVYCPRGSSEITAPDGVRLKPLLATCRARDWKLLRDEPIDVWHALAAPHAWLALTGRPTVVSVHGNDFLFPYLPTARPALGDTPLWRWEESIWRRFAAHWRRATLKLVQKSLPRAHAIFANSRYTADVLARQVPACTSRISVSWVGVDSGFLAVPRSARGHRPRLLTVSRLSEPRKNVGLVIRALGQLRGRHDFEYTVAGDGKEREALEALAAECGLGDRVHFAGRVSDARLKELYAEADLFVLTSSVIPGSHEGFGIVYLEAAAAGVPSLAARLAGAVDAVEDGCSGFFVNEVNVPSLAEALDSFLSGRQRFDSDACRAFASRFRWSAIVDQMLAHYPGTTGGTR